MNAIPIAFYCIVGVCIVYAIVKFGVFKKHLEDIPEKEEVDYETLTRDDNFLFSHATKDNLYLIAFAKDIDGKGLVSYVIENNIEAGYKPKVISSAILIPYENLKAFTDFIEKTKN